MTQPGLGSSSTFSSLASRTNTAASISSYSTAGTSPTSFKRPSVLRGQTWPKSAARDLLEHSQATSLHSEGQEPSEYPSTVSSRVDLDADSPRLPCVQEFQPGTYTRDATPSTSEDFSHLWPSDTTLFIHHDESTPDGHMNLRVDVNCRRRDGRQQKMILYHLRLKDLRSRAFVLRRYCRESGRDIFRSKRKLASQVGRPPLTRSFGSFLSRSFKSNVGGEGRPARLTRHFSAGHQSVFSSIGSSYDHDAALEIQPQLCELSDTVNLEFMNYQKLDLQRLLRRGKAHYHFDYWGRPYSWTLCDETGSPRPGFVLRRRTDYSVLARLVPEKLTEHQERQEELLGGWVPPCCLQLSPGIDIAHDLGDVIVSTGLLTFVDHAIRQTFPFRESRPTSSSALRPLRWIDDVVGRISRPTTAH